MNELTREEPDLREEDKYFQIEVRPKEDFVLFRTEEAGFPGNTLLVMGKQKNGHWATHKWLIDKKDAYITPDGKIKSDDFTVQRIIDYYCDGELVHKGKDVFQFCPCNDSREHRSCREEARPEMYFENYEEYEKYFADHTAVNH